MHVIGRDATRSELDAAFQSGERVVTLTGPGGIGKTTLARAYAREREGVLVDLTEAASVEGVASKLGLAIEVPLTSGGDHTAALAQALDPDALLVFDNCEQALEAVAAVVGALRAQRADLRVLSTSREPLGTPGERVLPLPLLDDESAVALLEARGRAAREDFSTGDQRDLATDIVRRLDRLPLAIELAAARLEVMTLEQLAARLEDQLRLLKRVGGARDRHATLRQTIAWSWDLLDDDARRTLAQCAVFRDGFTLEAVEAVVETEGWADDALQDLKRKSLVLTEQRDGGIRFRLLESVRAFALEKLRELELEAETLRRFVAWFAPALDEPRPWKRFSAEGCATLRGEMENLLVALSAARAGPAASPAAAAAAAHVLDRFFASEGPVEPHFRVLDEGVAAAEEAGDPALLGRLLLARGEAHRRRAHPDLARADFERAEGMIPDGDKRLKADVDLRFALLYMVTGDFAASEARARVVVESAKGADPRTAGLAHGLYGSLKLYFGRDESESALELERSLPYLREAEDDRSLGLTLANLGVVLIDRGDHEAGNERLNEAADRFTAIRDGFNLATVQINRALSLLDRGDPAGALPLLEETRVLTRRVGHHRLAAYTEMCVGMTALARGDLGEARERLVEAIDRAEDTRETATFGAAHAYLALVLARTGEDPGPTLARADELAAQHKAPWVQRVAAVCRAHVEGKSTAGVEDTPVQVRIAKSLALGDAPVEAGPSTSTLVIGPEARWMEVPGEARKDLSRRGPLRRILMALAIAHGGDSLDVNDLIEAGWPGEKMHPESGAARVYAAVRTLRKLGLEPWLITRDDGYLLDPDVEVERES